MTGNHKSCDSCYNRCIRAIIGVFVLQYVYSRDPVLSSETGF